MMGRLIGSVAVVVAFFAGCQTGQLNDADPVPARVDDVGRTRSYEIGWDLDQNAKYRATCEADRCAWETFEYVGWVSNPGLVPYRRDLQVRRGQSVTVDTSGVRELRSTGFGNWSRIK